MPQTEALDMDVPETITQQDLESLIVTAAREVSTTMLNLDLQPGKAYLKQNEPGPTDGVVSLIGLAGEWVGTGSVSCSSGCACLLSSQLLMSKFEAVNEEVLDAVAEITNMIIGNVKTHLEERLGRLGLSIPTVVYGLNFTTRSIGKNEWIVVPFHHGEHRMEVLLCLAPNRDRSARDGGAITRCGIESPRPAHR